MTEASALGRPVRPVSKSVPLPLYRQVEADLRERITSGELRPGHRLPSESELADMYAASRITVRHALANLVAERLISRESGRGTFVREPTVTVGARGPTSFTQELVTLKMQPGGRLLRREIAPADPDLAEKLRLPEGDQVVVLDRLRLGSGSPVGIQRARLVASMVPGLDEADLGNRSLYAHLESVYGIVPTEAEEVFRAGPIEGEDAELLDVPPGSCGLHAARLTFAGSRPFEYVRSVMRGDRYQVQLGLEHDRSRD